MDTEFRYFRYSSLPYGGKGEIGKFLSLLREMGIPYREQRDDRSCEIIISYASPKCAPARDRYKTTCVGEPLEAFVCQGTECSVPMTVLPLFQPNEGKDFEITRLTTLMMSQVRPSQLPPIETVRQKVLKDVEHPFQSMFLWLQRS